MESTDEACLARSHCPLNPDNVRQLGVIFVTKSRILGTLEEPSNLQLEQWSSVPIADSTDQDAHVHAFVAKHERCHHADLNVV